MNWAGGIGLTLATVATLLSFAGQPTANAQDGGSVEAIIANQLVNLG